MSFKGRIRRLDDKLERVKAVRGRTREWPADPVEFCVQYLGFTPTVYQEKLLRDPTQFIVARWSRQSGKTHCVAVLLLWPCLRNRGFNVLALAPAGTWDRSRTTLQLWAFALAIYYARLEPTEYHPVAAVNTRPSPGNLFPQLPKSIWKR